MRKLQTESEGPSAKRESSKLSKLGLLQNAEAPIAVSLTIREMRKKLIVQQPKVKAITASTDKTNAASYTVLEKNNFKKIGKSDELFHWKRKL